MKETILIVEDDPIVRVNLSDMLEFENFITIQAKDGQEALQLIGNQDISLILSDWIMPGMDGLQLLSKVRESKLWAHLPFIMLTAKGYKKLNRNLASMRINT